LDIGGRQLPFARPRPYHPAYPQVTQEIIKTMEAMYLQNAAVEASVKDLVSRMNPVMEAAARR
jgi:sn-glycerol 3-phosphate transport system substrate-binding protein